MRIRRNEDMARRLRNQKIRGESRPQRIHRRALPRLAKSLSRRPSRGIGVSACAASAVLSRRTARRVGGIAYDGGSALAAVVKLRGSILRRPRPQDFDSAAESTRDRKSTEGEEKASTEMTARFHSTA